MAQYSCTKEMEIEMGKALSFGVGKEFVVIKFVEAAGPNKSGKYEVWASYEGDIWGSPIYEVVEYFPTFRAAQLAVRSYKEVCSV